MKRFVVMLFEGGRQVASREFYDFGQAVKLARRWQAESPNGRAVVDTWRRVGDPLEYVGSAEAERRGRENVERWRAEANDRERQRRREIIVQRYRVRRDGDRTETQLLEQWAPIALGAGRG